MLEQVGNPLGVFDIRLAPRDCLDMVRIHDYHFQVAFQDIEDGFPEDTGTFHRHMATLLLSKPVAQSEQIWSHRTERLTLFATFSVGSRGDEAGHHGFLVDIQACTPFVDNLHAFPPLPSRNRSMQVSHGIPGQEKISYACFAW